MKRYSRLGDNINLEIALKEYEEVKAIEKDLEEKGGDSKYYEDHCNEAYDIWESLDLDMEYIYFEFSEEEGISYEEAFILSESWDIIYMTSGTMRHFEIYKKYKYWKDLKCNNTKYENELNEKEEEEYHSKLEILGLLPS